MKDKIVEKKFLRIIIASCGLGSFAMGLICFLWGNWFSQEYYSFLLDAQFKYLAGLLFALSLGLFSTIPHPEEKLSRFGWITLLFMAGGITQLTSLSFTSLSALFYSFPTLITLIFSLIIMPLVYFWIYRFSKHFS